MIDPLALLLEIAKEKTKLGKWSGQPLELIKVMPNSTKGDLVETFIIEYSKELGFDVVDRTNRLGDYDAKINGMTFEIKMATEDISGNFQFNHIRYDYTYDWILCVGIAPADIIFDIWSKADLVTGKAGKLVSMGRGQNSSFKLTKQKKSLHPISEFMSEIKSLAKEK
ncbi:MAG: hypothetical protein HYV37_03395 [Candidatus Levyibacteriota bacterium]|nr:MAG: hypothetical protein HYV37_03395 [Candidatus Levybacteria bacterium]